MEDSIQPLSRFFGRAENYRRFCPGYGREVVEYLKRRCDLGAGARVADVGAGTGIFSRVLLEAGFEVVAVEPNLEMRETCERDLGAHPHLKTVDAQAEALDLESASTDLIVAAQAFHWFDLALARDEFRRVLRSPGWVALIWNVRETESAFGSAFEEFLETWSVDYARVRGRGQVEARVRTFFDEGYEKTKFPNVQELSWDEFWGRYLSASYAPPPGHEKFEAGRKALQEIFARFAHNGRVRFAMDTEVYLGAIKAFSRENAGKRETPDQ